MIGIIFYPSEHCSWHQAQNSGCLIFRKLRHKSFQLPSIGRKCFQDRAKLRQIFFLFINRLRASQAKNERLFLLKLNICFIHQSFSKLSTIPSQDKSLVEVNQAIWALSWFKIKLIKTDHSPTSKDRFKLLNPNRFVVVLLSLSLFSQ